MHHNKTLHEDRVSKRPYKITFTCSFLWLCSVHSEGWICGWGIRHLHWPIDKEGGCWSVSPWQGVEHTNTSWLWVSNDFFWSQRHGKNMTPHLGRALFHISPLMPMALPTAGVSRVQDSSLKHPHFKTKVPKPFSTRGWFWVQLALDWAVAMWCRKIMQQIGTQWDTFPTPEITVRTPGKSITLYMEIQLRHSIYPAYWKCIWCPFPVSE